MQDTSRFDTAELAAFPLFADLEKPLPEQFLQDQRVLTVPAGHQLIFEADWSDGLFLIRSGVVKVRRITLDGEEVVIALMGVGEMFGELAMLLGDSRRSADVVSLTPLEVVKLHWNPIQQELDRRPSFALKMATLQARRLVDLGKRLSLRGEDATTRVLATLLELACCTNYENDPQGLIPCLTQTEIAAIAGLARGTTSKVLSKLRSRGTVLETSEGMRLSNLEPLRKRGLIQE